MYIYIYPHTHMSTLTIIEKSTNSQNMAHHQYASIGKLIEKATFLPLKVKQKGKAKLNSFIEQST